MPRSATFVIVAGAVIGNMSLIFGLLMRPRPAILLWVGGAAYLIAAVAWLLHRVRD